MKFVDVHCHIYHDIFKDNFEEVLQKAEKAGVQAIVISGVNPAANKTVLELSKKYPILKASLGIYPIDALGLSEEESGLPRQTEKIDIEKELKFIEKHKDEIVSIGEIGMDFHWASKEDTYDQQAKNFRKIIRFAKKMGKTIVVHSRKAERECLDILKDELPNNEIPIVNHCFSGKKSLIKEAAELGYYFSVPAVINKLQHFQTLVELVDLKQLLTETDAPWLSPFPGRPNEPAYIPEAIKKIAEIKGLSEEEVAKQVWKNYQKVFTL